MLNIKWQIRHLEDIDGNEKELDLHYGKAIYQYGYGSLEFNEDGTFVEIYPGVLEGNGYGIYSLDGNLIIAYTSAYIINSNNIYIDTAEKTAEYILKEMTSECGGFYSAQDADSEGVERIL